MNRRRIMYYNNCWFTNVGEAFIDLGSFVMIKKIFGEGAVIICASSMPKYYMQHRHNLLERCLKRVLPAARNYFNKQYGKMACNLFALYDADYFILSGMFATEEFIDDSGDEILELAKNGIKIIFLGLGGANYTKQETETFIKYLEKIKPALVVTRDYATYLNYKDAANCVSGIDCAFWVIDSYDPRGMAKYDYDVVAFNRSKEPFEYSQNWPRPIVRPKHFQYSFTPPPVKYKYKNKYKDNLMLSDSPYDYLTLYANAHAVYTDLVHATVTALQYGIPVKFFPTDGRAQLFDSIKDLKKDAEGFLTVDALSLAKQKEQLIAQVKTILKQ